MASKRNWHNRQNYLDRKSYPRYHVVSIAGRKSLLFEAILAFFVVWHYTHKTIHGRTLALLVIPALFIISLSFYFKDYGFKTQSIEAQYSGQPAWEAVVDPLINRSYQFDALTMIVDKTRSAGDYRLGSTFEDVLWFYVPRQLWPTKPISFGYSFGPEFFPGSSITASYTPSMVGELYLDFGLIGVAAASTCSASPSAHVMNHSPATDHGSQWPCTP